MSLLWYWNTLQQDELMWYLYQNTRAVTCLVARLCATMLHVFQHFQGIVHQFVTLATIDVNHHTDTASVVLHIGSVQSFFHHIVICILILSNASVVASC